MAILYFQLKKLKLGREVEMNTVNKDSLSF